MNRVSDRRSFRLPCAGLVALAAGLAPLGVASPLSAQPPEGAMESPGKLPASRYLSPEQLAGAEWKVAPEAATDGMFNIYTVESRFGSFQARGSSLLAVRVKEVEALAELEKVSKSKVFTDAVAKAAVAPVKLVLTFAESPTETVQGISGGVKRLWSKTRFQAKEVSHDAKQAVAKDGSEGGETEESKTEKAKQATSDYAKKYLGLSGAERRWYGQLGVDPYTDNETLKQAVKEVSRVEAAASFGMRFAGLPSIPGARELGKVMDLVWSTDPWELRQRNRKILLDAGLTEDQARAFEDNQAMSPTLQTALIETLTHLTGVSGRQNVILRAAEIEDANAARMLVTSTALLVRYHQQLRPLFEILPGPALPVARTKQGGIVAVAAVDAVFWTADVSAAVKEFDSIYAKLNATSRELRIVGEASQRFKEEMGGLGWRVQDHWQIAKPEDKVPPPAPAAKPKS